MMSSRKANQENDVAVARASVGFLSGLVGLVFVAIVLTFQPFGLDQFLLPKALVLLVGGSLIAGMVVARGTAIRGDLLLSGLVLTFLVWSVVAPLVHARNRSLHLIGAGEALMLAVVFLGALGARASGERGVRRLVRLLALPAVIIAPLAVAQGLGIDPLRLFFDLSSVRPGRWQVLTTLGNPSWTAELLVLLLPVVLAAGKPSGTLRRWWPGAVTLVCCIGVALTGSRGAVVGMVVAAVMGWRLGLVRRGRWIAAAGVIVVGVFVVATGWSRLGEMKPLTGRLGLWAAGVHLVGQEPLTGWGLRHTALVLPEGLSPVVAGLDPELTRWLPTVLVDRLDEDLLQVAAERGLPAAFILLLIWCRTVWLSLKRYRRERQVLDGVIVVVLTTFGVLSLGSAPFHTPATAVLFWILVGFVAGAGPVSVAGGRERARRRVWAGVLGGTAVAVAVLWWVALPVVRSNAIAGAAHWQVRDGQFEEASTALAPVVARMPWMTGASIDSSRALVGAGRTPEALVVLDNAQHWASSEWFWATRARALARLGLGQQARRELEAGLGVLPRSPVLLEARSEFGAGGSISELSGP
jgi:O-antigen ligase